MRLLSLFVLAAGSMGAVTASLAASTEEDFSLGSKDRYQHCTALVRENAQRAYEQALGWKAVGGGAASEHCAALALVQLKRYGEAARKLDALGVDRTVGDAAGRAELLDQAGNVWLLARQPQDALHSFAGALTLSPRDANILSDRARARALAKDWVGADADLSAALAQDANRADLLVLRASARHALGRGPEARADIDRALAIYPGYGDALVERGAIKFESGDKPGARTDWQLVLKSAPNTPAGESARRYIAGMDAAAASPAPATVKR